MSNSLPESSQNVITVNRYEGELYVDSRLVALNLDIQHRNFLETIKKYETVITQRFGSIRVKTESSTMPNGAANPKPIKFVWLTEDQAIFLMTLSRNTERVVECKANLVSAFASARAGAVQHKIPQTYAEALLEAGRLALENERLEAKIEQDAPLVSYASAVQASETALDMNEYAKSINWGRNRLFRVLRELGVIMKNSTLPYQRWLDAGYFEVSQEIVTTTGKLVPFALVTGKGQIWLKQKIDAFLAQEKRQQEAFGAMLMNSVFPTA